MASLPQRASPPRRPLHERSDSQTNKLGAPLIRPVPHDDEQPYNHDSRPFPVWPPRGQMQPAEPLAVSDVEPFPYQHITTRPPSTSATNSPHLIKRWSEGSEPVFGLESAQDTTIHATEIDYDNAPPQRQNRGSVVWRPSESTSTLTPSRTSYSSLDGRYTFRPNAPRTPQPSRLSHRISTAETDVAPLDQSDIDPHAAGNAQVPGRARHHPLESRFSITRPEADQATSSSDLDTDQMAAGHATRYRSTSYSAFPSITVPNYAKAPLPPVPYPLPPASSKSNQSTPSPRPHSRPSTARRRPAQAKSQKAAPAAATIQYPVVKPPSSQSSWAESSIATPERVWTREEPPAHDQHWVAAGFPKAESPGAEPDLEGELGDGSDPSQFRRRTGSSSMMVGIAVTSGPEDPSPPDSSGLRNVRSSTIRVVSEGHAYNSSRISSHRASDFRISSLPDKLPDPSRQSIGGIAQGEPVIRPSVLAISLPDWAR